MSGDSTRTKLPWKVLAGTVAAAAATTLAVGIARTAPADGGNASAGSELLALADGELIVVALDAAEQARVSRRLSEGWRTDFDQLDVNLGEIVTSWGQIKSRR